MAKKKKKKGYKKKDAIDQLLGNFGMAWGGDPSTSPGRLLPTKEERRVERARRAKIEARKTVVTRKAGRKPEKKEEAKFYLRGRGGKGSIPLKGSEKEQREAWRKHGKDPDPDELRAARWAGVDISPKKGKRAARKKREARQPRKKVTRR